MVWCGVMRLRCGALGRPRAHAEGFGLQWQRIVGMRVERCGFCSGWVAGGTGTASGIGELVGVGMSGDGGAWLAT